MSLIISALIRAIVPTKDGLLLEVPLILFDVVLNYSSSPVPQLQHGCREAIRVPELFEANKPIDLFNPHPAMMR